MYAIFTKIILILFPILMYLVFSCYNVLNNGKMNRIIFIITMCTSLYLSLDYISINSISKIYLFCNIPILICYFKREWLLGVIFSIIVIVYNYYVYDISNLLSILKFIIYLVGYFILCKKREFNYLFFKVMAVVQGFFLAFEYFMNPNTDIKDIHIIMIYMILILCISYLSLYLFKLADNITSLYVNMNKVNEENKLKNSLFKLTHEIKNPIAVCKGYLDMINIDNKEKTVKYIGIIKSEIDRSLNVMNDFMEYSKIKVNLEMFDMNVLLEEINDLFSLLIKDKNIEFNYHNSYDEIYVNGDYERLKQVFINIIKNSIESIGNSGIIGMDALIINREVLIKISDTGMGMTEEELANVKEMFYTTKKNGTGLGVALSNEIILAHSGKITYDSVKDVGTTCIVSLPI